MELHIGTMSGGMVAEKIEHSTINVSAGEVVVKNIEGDERHQNFAFMMHSGHTPGETEKAMDELRIMCGGDNSRALTRKLLELEDKGYIQVRDVRPGELYEELHRTFSMPYITEKAFQESFRLLK